MSAILTKIAEQIVSHKIGVCDDEEVYEADLTDVIAIIKRVVAEEMPAMAIPRQRVSSLGYTDGYRKGRNEFRSELLGDA